MTVARCSYGSSCLATLTLGNELLKVLRQVALNRTNLPVRDFGINLHRGEAEDELQVVALAALKGNGNLLLDDVLLIRVFLAVSCAPCI